MNTTIKTPTINFPPISKFVSSFRFITRILNLFLISYIRATCLVHLLLSDLIILKTLDYVIFSRPLYFLHLTSNCLTQHPVFKHPESCYSLGVRHQVHSQTKTVGNTAIGSHSVHYILQPVFSLETKH
jgi:hypothetical protein